MVAGGTVSIFATKAAHSLLTGTPLTKEFENTTIGEILLSYLPGPAKASGRILKALISAA